MLSLKGTVSRGFRPFFVRKNLVPIYCKQAQTVREKFSFWQRYLRKTSGRIVRWHRVCVVNDYAELMSDSEPKSLQWYTLYIPLPLWENTCCICHTFGLHRNRTCLVASDYFWNIAEGTKRTRNRKSGLFRTALSLWKTVFTHGLTDNSSTEEEVSSHSRTTPNRNLKINCSHWNNYEVQ